MGTWSLRARLGGNHARAGAGPGSGPGLGLSSGSGSLPGLVLFELGLMGMGYAKHTRSAIRIRTAPPTAVSYTHLTLPTIYSV